MNLRVFERLLKAKKDAGKAYIVLAAVKELAVPFCYLAKKYNFNLDGLILINQTQILPQDYSGVTLIDLKNNTFTPKLCFMIMAVPGQPLQLMWQPFAQMGFGMGFALTNDDINEMFKALQSENFLVEKIRAELLNESSERIFIFDSPKAQVINNVMMMSGVPVDGMIKSLESTSANSLTLVPVENTQQQTLMQSMTQQQSGKILPLYAGDLIATEQYWNAHQVFRDYFDLNNVPDFVSKYETAIKYILNAYDGVNISFLKIDDEAQIAMTCALSFVSTDKKMLQAVIPINSQGNQVDYAAGMNNFLLNKFPARLRCLTLESREFWRYFITKQPAFVTYSNSVYDYYAARYRNEPLKINSTSLELTAESADEYILFAINGNADWYETVSAQLQSRGLRAIRLDKPRCSAEGVALMSKAKLIVSDSLTDRWLAMLYGVPIVLINMAIFTLDENLIVRSDKTPMLMIPKLFINPAAKNLVCWWNILLLEEQMLHYSVLMDFYRQRNIQLIGNMAEDIINALNEMLARIEGKTAYTDEDNLISRAANKYLTESKKTAPRDVYDDSISIKFLKKYEAAFGEAYNQRHGFLLKDFLPAPKAAELNVRPKIKVRLFYMRHWNTVQTICQSCAEDENIDLLIIAESTKDAEFVAEEGYNCLFKDNYDIKSDRPDIFLLSYGIQYPSHLTIGDIRKYSRLIVVPIHALVPYGGMDRFIQLTEDFFAKYEPEYYLFDSYLYKRTKDVDYFKNKPLFEMGNGKYDGIYNAYVKDSSTINLDRDWKKLLDKKKVICWASTHGFNLVAGLSYMPDITFDIYAKDFFLYASEHSDIGFIFRPHPLFVPEMNVKSFFWSDGDLATFRQYCRKSSNIVFDETPSYDNTFALSDAILFESNGGIAISALPTMKPLALTLRKPDVLLPNPDITDICYKITSVQEMLNFFGMIERGEDPMREFRQQKAKEYVKHFDGKNGWRIKEFIKQAFKDKFN